MDIHYTSPATWVGLGLEKKLPLLLPHFISADPEREHQRNMAAASSTAPAPASAMAMPQVTPVTEGTLAL